jgi:GAF domain-containing protein/sugar diacid utilization regulator
VILGGMGLPAVDQTIARLLHMLATEAPREAFEQLAEIVEASPPGPDRDEMLVAIARSGRIRELLSHRKRREKETHALIESARDLASLRDVEELLDAVVRRARQLLGTDATYLALRDPVRGDVYMRVTHGTVTRGIEQVRQPLGSGIGGRIIATGEPFATSNYLNDPRIDRNRSVTDAVVEDGIVSIAGVPMRVGDVVMGALFVATRYERWFDDYEIDLLGSLADHASIVIENARLFAHAEIAAQRLRETNTELARQGRELERAAAAHEQLVPIALRRADLGELVQAVAGMLGGTLAAVGDDGSVLALAGEAELPAGLPPPDGGAVAARPVAGRPGTWVVPVRAGEESFGRLVLVGAGPPSDADVRTLERAAQTAALLLLMDQQVSAAERQVRGELIDDLLAEREPDWSTFDRRARRSGAIDFRTPHTVLVLAAPGVARRHLLRVATDHAVRRGGIATEHAAQVVVLLPHLDAEAARAVPARLARVARGVVTAGIAGPAESVQDVRRRHREAERCLRLALALGRDGEGVRLADLGVMGLVLESTSVGRLQALLARTVDPLVRYDQEHNALLVETLDAYFAAGQNPRAAAKALQVHPNTVYQRLERVDQILGRHAWRDPQGALSMQLAVELHRVRAHVPLDLLVGPLAS